MTIQEWFDKRKEAQIERRAKDMKGIDVETPELININTKDDQSPDIEIAIV